MKIGLVVIFAKVQALKGDADAIFLDLIRTESPHSYLLRNENVEPSKNRNIELQKARFWAKIGGDSIKEKLMQLKRITLLVYDGKTIIQQPDNTQRAILESFGLKLEGVVI